MTTKQNEELSANSTGIAATPVAVSSEAVERLLKEIRINEINLSSGRFDRVHNRHNR